MSFALSTPAVEYARKTLSPLDIEDPLSCKAEGSGDVAIVFRIVRETADAGKGLTSGVSRRSSSSGSRICVKGRRVLVSRTNVIERSYARVERLV